MKRIIILEGMDSTGKSTLAKFLAGYFDAFYIHALGHRDLHPCMETYHLSLLQTAEQNFHNGHSVVMDRHWPSEFCYGRMLRPRAVKYDFTKMIDRLEQSNPIYIYCKSTGSFVRHQQTHENHDRYSVEKYNKVQAEYNILFDTVKHIQYSLEEHGLYLTDFAKTLPL